LLSLTPPSPGGFDILALAYPSCLGNRPLKRARVVVVVLIGSNERADCKQCQLWRVAGSKSDADKSSVTAVRNAAAERTVTSSQPGTVNAKSYQSRLGLARTLSRQSADLNEIKKWYIEAIDMAPDVSCEWNVSHTGLNWKMCCEYGLHSNEKIFERV